MGKYTDIHFKFSQLISTVKNKRFLDARLHRIDEITQVDSFLVAGDYLNKSDVAYFTSLYDLWMYGDLFERKSGQELSVYSSCSQHYPRSETSKNGIKSEPYKSTDKNFGVGINYSFEKPVRLSWQHSVAASLTYNYDVAFQGKFKNSTVNLPVKYTLGYYPNTRTHFQLSTEEWLRKTVIDRKYLAGYTEYKEKTDNLSAITSLALNAFYYVSPHLLLSAEVAANLEFAKYKFLERDSNIGYPENSGNYSKWDTNIEFKVTYKLF